MLVNINNEAFNRLWKISNIKRQYIGDVAVELLEKAIMDTDIEALKKKHGREGYLSGGDAI